MRSIQRSVQRPCVCSDLLHSRVSERLTWLLLWGEVCLQLRLPCSKPDVCRALLQAHEVEGCSLPANISDRANLTVAGQALTALGGSDLFGSHGTIFLPNDAAFTALLTALGECLCL